MYRVIIEQFDQGVEGAVVVETGKQTVYTQTFEMIDVVKVVSDICGLAQPGPVKPANKAPEKVSTGTKAT